MYYNEKTKKKAQSSLSILSSAKHSEDSDQINYNLYSKRLGLANLLYKAFSIIPLSNSWHLILQLTVPIRVITLKL